MVDFSSSYANIWFLRWLVCDRKYTKYPHLAGTDGETELGEEIYRTWLEQGLDYVTNNTYDILLSYPNKTDPSYVYLIDDNNQIKYTTQTAEKIVREDQNDSRVVSPFNAYSPAAEVTVLTRSLSASISLSHFIISYEHADSPSTRITTILMMQKCVTRTRFFHRWSHFGA